MLRTHVLVLPPQKTRFEKTKEDTECDGGCEAGSIGKGEAPDPGGRAGAEQRGHPPRPWTKALRSEPSQRAHAVTGQHHEVSASAREPCARELGGVCRPPGGGAVAEAGAWGDGHCLRALSFD